MNIVHLMASPFYGGPERQVLGLARSLPAEYQTVFLSFAERGLSEDFLNRARTEGFSAVCLRENAPHLLRASAEVADRLRQHRADVLCCSGYKPDIIGWLAARRAGVPVLAIAHGWTSATWKVRIYEALDRLVMRGMDAVVAVSAAQAAKVRKAGVRPGRIHVIRNAIHTAALARVNPHYKNLLLGYFPRPPRHVVVSAGRLSSEKGFEVLIEAASQVCARYPETGFVLFGEGPLRAVLARQIVARRLQEHFILAGFRRDVEAFLPHADLAVLSSYTEGLPVVVLEAMAAGLPVVATAVGGTPEVIDEGLQGHLVPAGDPGALARRIGDLLTQESVRRAMGARARQRIAERFTFAAQAQHYQQLFQRLAGLRCKANKPDRLYHALRTGNLYP